ncbi:MAG TPA: LacI family DNA-binding transcriptional regulator [Acidobacteriaceae bacterium]
MAAKRTIQTKNKPATLADIAAIAGVAPMTASRALNASGYVSEEVRKRVQQAAETLRYSPNKLARQLRGSRLLAIGILLPDLANPFFAEIVKCMTPPLREAGYTVFVAMAGSEDEEAATRSFIDHRIDGLVVTTHGTREGNAMLKRIAGQGTPVVIVGRPTPLPNIDTVTSNFYQGAYDAVSHLIGLGHRRVGFLGAASSAAPALRRFEGYTAALQNAGIIPDPSYVVDAAAGLAFSTEEDGFTGLMKLRELPQPPTAVFARNDYTAIGALRAAHTLGLAVPQDLAIAGFDNIPLAAFQTPPLTTVEQPIAELARVAAELLLQRMEDAPRRPRQTVELACRLVVRDSTDPARAAQRSVI